MIGGLGDDVYVVESTGDVLIEKANEGTDLVVATISWALAANVENLELRGSGAINGTGNGANNVISGNGAGNVLDGGGGDDLFLGRAGGDRLIGGGGNDMLIGGAGQDTVQYAGTRASYAVTKVGHRVSVTGPDGSDTLASIERLTFSDETLDLGSHVRADQNGDGTADYVWRHSGGGIVMWQMDGASQLTNAYLGVVPTNWRIQNATADFNGDGKADILWRQDDGMLVNWQMDGATQATNEVVATVPTDWFLMPRLNEII